MLVVDKSIFPIIESFLSFYYKETRLILQKQTLKFVKKLKRMEKII